MLTVGSGHYLSPDSQLHGSAHSPETQSHRASPKLICTKIIVKHSSISQLDIDERLCFCSFSHSPPFYWSVDAFWHSLSIFSAKIDCSFFWRLKWSLWNFMFTYSHPRFTEETNVWSTAWDSCTLVSPKWSIVESHDFNTAKSAENCDYSQGLPGLTWHAKCHSIKKQRHSQRHIQLISFQALSNRNQMVHIKRLIFLHTEPSPSLKNICHTLVHKIWHKKKLFFLTLHHWLPCSSESTNPSVIGPRRSMPQSTTPRGKGWAGTRKLAPLSQSLSIGINKAFECQPYSWRNNVTLEWQVLKLNLNCNWIPTK